MILTITPAICTLAGLLVCVDLLAVTPEASRGHYQTIPDRNAFGLKSPTPSIVTPPPPPLPRLTLTGITTILGNKRALLKVLPPAGAPGQPAKEESMILTEGQRQGDVEVLSIDENAGSVRANNSGTVMTLTFEKDGAKLPNTPPPPAAPPGLPARTNANPAVPSALASAPPSAAQPGMHSKRRSFPTGEIRSPAELVPAQTTSNPAAPAPSVSGAPQASGLPQGPTQNLTSEDQAIVVELQREPGSN